MAVADGDVLRRRQLWKRFAQLNVLRNFAARFRDEVQAHGLRTTDGSLAVLVTGSLDLKLFTAILDSIPEGTWEFVCHPGYNDADLAERAHPFAGVAGPGTGAADLAREQRNLAARGIELISYREL